MDQREHYLSKAMEYIPGVTQLLSKRPDQFGQDIWPTYYSRARGSKIWDVGGKKYLDMSISGIGANVLGYCDPDVDGQVIRAIRKGNSTSLNSPADVNLAELMLDIHPWASKVRYARTGGEAMAIAVRVARAATGRDIVLFCGYHGWHDWYLSANLRQENSLASHLLPGLDPLGVPKGLEGTAIPFTYNNLSELKELMDIHSGKVAAVVMEPVRSQIPDRGFLEGVRSLASANGAALIFDEISSGFRYTLGGYHLTTSVTPDVAVFAKAMSNGYPMAAIIGTSAVMDEFTKTFVSSTFWSESIGPVAALATIHKLRKLNVHEKLGSIGARVREIWEFASEQHGVSVQISGLPAMSYLKFDYPDQLEVQTMYTQIMLDSKILAGGRFYANHAHSPRDVDRFESAVNAAFTTISHLLERGEVKDSLRTRVARPGFGRLN
jgi:glutamate-1-semialdehyde aminotransferase